MAFAKAVRSEAFTDKNQKALAGMPLSCGIGQEHTTILPAPTRGWPRLG